LFPNGKRADKNGTKIINKIYRLKIEKNKTDKTDRESEKQKAFFIGNIFLRLGKSKNACALWSA
jgi:hypothetical protein